MKYYYLVMTQQDFLKNQVIEEILRERINYYVSKKQPLDFWVILSPSFLFSSSLLEKISQSNFYTQKKEFIEFNNFPYFATLISTNPDYLGWLKLRLGYFENIIENSALNSSFRSDGIYGIFQENSSPFESIPNNIHPSILLDKYKKSLEMYYIANEKLLN